MTRVRGSLRCGFDFDNGMRHCPHCGGCELQIIGAILERPVIEKIPSQLALHPQPPPPSKGRAREAGHDFAGWAALATQDTRHIGTGCAAQRQPQLRCTTCTPPLAKVCLELR